MLPVAFLHQYKVSREKRAAFSLFWIHPKIHNIISCFENNKRTIVLILRYQLPCLLWIYLIYNLEEYSCVQKNFTTKKVSFSNDIGNQQKSHDIMKKKIQTQDFYQLCRLSADARVKRVSIYNNPS